MRPRLIARYDHSVTEPEVGTGMALGYCSSGTGCDAVRGSGAPSGCHGGQADDSSNYAGSIPRPRPWPVLPELPASPDARSQRSHEQRHARRGSVSRVGVLDGDAWACPTRWSRSGRPTARAGTTITPRQPRGVHARIPAFSVLAVRNGRRRPILVSTIRPGAVPMGESDAHMQAPHICVLIFAPATQPRATPVTSATNRRRQTIPICSMCRFETRSPLTAQPLTSTATRFTGGTSSCRSH